MRKIGRLTYKATDSSRFFTSECRAYPTLLRKNANEPVWSRPAKRYSSPAPTLGRFLTTFHSLIFLVFCTKLAEHDDNSFIDSVRGKLADLTRFYAHRM